MRRAPFVVGARGRRDRGRGRDRGRDRDRRGRGRDRRDRRRHEYGRARGHGRSRCPRDRPSRRGAAASPSPSTCGSGPRARARRRSARRPADLLGLLADLHRHARVLHARVVVVDLDALGGGHGPQRQVGLDRLLGLGAGTLEELCGVWPVADSHCARGRCPGPGTAGRFWSCCCISAFTIDSGASTSTSAASASVSLPMTVLADLVELALGEPLADRRGPLLDGVELAGVLGDPLVGELGQRQLLDGLDGDGEVGRLLGALGRGGEGEHVAGAGAR
jgi:hypothetical protein